MSLSDHGQVDTASRLKTANNAQHSWSSSTAINHRVPPELSLHITPVENGDDGKNCTASPPFKPHHAFEKAALGQETLDFTHHAGRKRQKNMPSLLSPSAFENTTPRGENSQMCITSGRPTTQKMHGIPSLWGPHSLENAAFRFERRHVHAAPRPKMAKRAAFFAFPRQPKITASRQDYI